MEQTIIKKEISIKELWKRFDTNNEVRPFKVESAIVVFKDNAFAVRKKRTEEQRSFKFSSDSKCFQAWMGGYSCFAVNVADSDIVWRIERMLNERFVEKVYIIKEGN